MWDYHKIRQKEINTITNINFECDKDGVSSNIKRRNYYEINDTEVTKIYS